MIVHNVKGKVIQDYPNWFIFNNDIVEPGWGLGSAFIKENLRQRGYRFPMKAFASVDIPEYIGGDAIVVDIYFSRKRDQ